MKKILVYVFLVFSMVTLAGCVNPNVIGTYDGNDVVRVDVGVNSVYKKVTDDVEQVEILTEITNLNYAPTHTVQSVPDNYSVRLTYADDSGCVFNFSFQDNTYSKTPFDTEGNTLEEETVIYTARDEELARLEELIG